jgi:hypothetical protein
MKQKLTTGCQKVVHDYRPNGRRQLGGPLNRLLDYAKISLLNIAVFWVNANSKPEELISHLLGGSFKSHVGLFKA